MPAAWKERGVSGRIATLACAALMGTLPQPVFAEDDDAQKKPHSYPYVKGELSIEVQHDSIVDADDPDKKGSDTFTTTELEIGSYLSPFFALHSHFTLEPVKERGPGEDRFFGDHGLYAEQLYAKFSFDPFEIDAGKIRLPFGRAWDDTPGIYGTDIADDYKVTERIGAGVSASREHTAIGKVTVHAATFFADTTFLSDSLFTSRGRRDRADGGLSNTERFDSFLVSLEGEDVPGLAGVSYNLGFVHQAAGVDDRDDQNGFVFGLKKEHTYNNVKFEWIGETAYFDYGGDLYDTDDPTLFVESLWYWTLGGRATFNDRYRVNAAYTARNAELFNGTEFNDYQLAASAGVKLWRDWWLDAGYRFLSEQDDDSHYVGLLLSRTIEFETGVLESMNR